MSEVCEYMHANEELVKKVHDSMPQEDFLFDLAELYKIFGDSTRIKILYVLFKFLVKHTNWRGFSPTVYIML